MRYAKLPYFSKLHILNVRTCGYALGSALTVLLALVSSLNAQQAKQRKTTIKNQGSIMVEPKRVVIENGARTGAVSIIRMGDDSGTYSLTLSDMRMTSDGNLIALNDSTERDSMSARKIIRFFPHEVTLGPNESQVIRIQVLKTAGLAPGEYRSHMTFTPIEKVAPITKLSDTSTEINMKVSLLLGVTIPIIFRNGTTAGPVTISDMSIDRDSTGAHSTLNLKLNRSGNQSIYGSLIARFIPNDGDPVRIGLMKGIGVYTDLLYRNVKMPVDVSKINLKDGKIDVSFETYTGQPKETQLAKAEMKS